MAAPLVRPGGALNAQPYRFALLVLAVLLTGPALEAITLPRAGGNVVAGRA